LSTKQTDKLHVTTDRLFTDAKKSKIDEGFHSFIVLSCFCLETDFSE